MTALASPPPVSTTPPAGDVLDGLRTATRSLHERCEQALDLRAGTRTPEAYASLLVVFESFQLAVECSLGDVSALAPADLVAGRRRRLARLRDDLGRLGHDRGPVAVGPERLVGLGRQLGAWYVLEGSALGGTVIAREVRRALPGVVGATTFLAGEGRDTMARWRRFHGFLEECVVRERIAREELRAGAETAFRRFVTIAEGA